MSRSGKKTNTKFTLFSKSHCPSISRHRSRLLGETDLLEKVQLLLDLLHLAERVSILHLENVPRLHKQLDQLFGVHFKI